MKECLFGIDLFSFKNLTKKGNGHLFMSRITKILTAAKIRIPTIFNMTYFTAELLIYFDLSRGKFRFLFIPHQYKGTSDIRNRVLRPVYFSLFIYLFCIPI